MTRLGRLGRRLRDERGFTLIELLTASVIGMVIMLVAFGLLDSTIRAFGSSEERTDVAQRGRLAIDAVTQRLRSPVCLEANGTSAVISADSNGIVFWSDTTGSDFRNGNPQPVVRELRAGDGVLTERVRPSIGGTATDRELATGVAQVDTTPFFRYWALSPSTTPPRQANVPLGSPVSPPDLARVARISVSFQINPRGGNLKSAAQFQNDVYVRSIDTTSTLGAIRCGAR